MCDRIHRGTNVVFKTFPYVPDTRPDANPNLSFNQNDARILAQNGVTVIRLGVLWSGVEPEQGVYNHTYLEELAKIVRYCGNEGIYVLLDFHQDLLNERFCGEGVPFYVVNATTSNDFPSPLGQKYVTNDKGLPSAQDCDKFPWGVYHISSAVSKAYQNLYDNTNGILDSLLDFWEIVARHFVNFDNILGHDLINEPWLGDIYKDTHLLDKPQGVFTNQHILEPFYDKIAERIRSVNPDAIIFFEPTTLVQKEVGFTSVPGGETQFGLKDTLGFRLDSAKELSCGYFLSEYEMGWGTGGDNVPNILETIQVADHFLLSTTGWDYKDYTISNGPPVFTGANNGLIDPDNHQVRPRMAKVWSRPYAHTIAGIPTLMQYNDETGEFQLQYEGSGMGGVTEIRTNFEHHFTNGMQIEVSGTYDYVISDQSIIIQSNDRKVTIKLNPK
ncbi:UNVERIFIED_CONTAM: hypothetical protein HDU68_000623 [Siphonaria sp. JEL0065]|nr:hypothetical protein HDU68_000623 [Siphonaria sp. JEL0065]